MNKKQRRARIAQLERQVAGFPARETVDLREVTLRGELANLLAQAGADEAAAVQYERLCQLAQDADDAHGAALAAYGAAVCRVRQGNPSVALTAVEAALGAAQRAGALTVLAKSHALRASLARDAGHLQLAIAQVTTAIQLLRTQGEAPDWHCRMLQTRASLALLLTDRRAARRDLGAALQLATAGGLSDIKQSLLLDRALLDSLEPAGGATADAVFEALHQRARRNGSQAQFGAATLQRALLAYRRRRYQQALTLAKSASSGALSSTDPQRYMQYFTAALLAATIYEKQGEREAVLRTLLSCKASLEGALGKPAGDLVRPFLDLLQLRWGAVPLAQALQRYTTQMRTQTAV